MDKQNERRLLEQFMLLFDEFPKGRLVPGESPDFLLWVNRRKTIGIELTELKGQDFIQHSGRLQEPGELIHNLRETMAAKDGKLVLYRQKKLHQIWLLIHLQRLGKINFNFQNKLEKIFFSSGFDRVFLLISSSGQLFELNPASL
jgi:hypothetical protein